MNEITDATTPSPSETHAERKLHRYQLVGDIQVTSNETLICLDVNVLRDDIRKPLYGHISGKAYDFLGPDAARRLARALVNAARKIEAARRRRERLFHATLPPPSLDKNDSEVT